jgi:hypothetical protein
MVLTFGRYYGKSLSDPAVPTDYLEWLDANFISSTVSPAVEAELRHRERMRKDARKAARCARAAAGMMGWETP